MSDPRATADRYVEVACADGKGALAELFAPDAEFHAPNGTIYQGRDEIRGFYDKYLAARVPEFHIQRALADETTCWIELADGTSADPIYRASNHFTVDGDGFITQLIVFLRPPTASLGNPQT